MTMFENDIIDIKELKSRTDEINNEIKEIQKKLDVAKFNIDKEKLLEENVKSRLMDISKALEENNFTNSVLSMIIEKISVNENGEVKIYLNLLD